MVYFPIPLVSDDLATDAKVSSVYGKYLETDRPVPVLYRLLANSPGLLNVWYEFATELRDGSASPRALRELVIMRVAQLTCDSYEWQIHRPVCLGLGVPERKLDELGDWTHSESFDPSERAVLLMADELTLIGDPQAGTMEAVAALFPPAQLIELLLTVAFYACVSRVTRAFDMTNNDADGVVMMRL